MSVRSALPWPFRWAVLAIVFGFCAAIGLWAFEFGKDIAGLEHGGKEQMQRLNAEIAHLRTELAEVKEDRDQAQSIANTAGTLVTAEKTSHERVLAQLKQLEEDNRTLRDDLGFFEKLIPASAVGGIAIRGVQAELGKDAKLKWQVLVIQANKNAAEFNGQLEVSFTGLLDGKPWVATLEGGPQTLKVRQYARLVGELELPARVMVKGVTAKVLEGPNTRATQSIKL